MLYIIRYGEIVPTGIFGSQPVYLLVKRSPFSGGDLRKGDDRLGYCI